MNEAAVLEMRQYTAVLEMRQYIWNAVHLSYFDDVRSSFTEKHSWARLERSWIINSICYELAWHLGQKL